MSFWRWNKTLTVINIYTALTILHFVCLSKHIFHFLCLRKILISKSKKLFILTSRFHRIIFVCHWLLITCYTSSCNTFSTCSEYNKTFTLSMALEFGLQFDIELKTYYIFMMLIVSLIDFFEVFAYIHLQLIFYKLVLIFDFNHLVIETLPLISSNTFK